MTEFESKDHINLITELNEYDVLCGRGSGPNERIGNIKFRDLVNTRKEEYLAINPRDYTNKNRIAKEIVEVVRSLGGRFLKKVPLGLGDDEAEVYELANETTVLEKAKQALRQNRAGRLESRVTADAHTENQPRAESAEFGLEAGGPRAGGQGMSPQSNPCQAFVSNFHQENYAAQAALSPAESAIRNLQLRNQLAQQKQSQVNSMHSTPNFATSGGGGDQYRNDIAMQQFKAMEDYHINNIMSGQPHFPTAADTRSDQIKFHLEQQMKQKQHENSILQTPSFATAGGGIDPETGHSSASAQHRHDIAMQQYQAIQDYHINNIMSGHPNFANASATHSDQIKFHREQQLKHSLAGLGGNTAPAPHVRQYHKSTERTSFTENAFSESQLKVLENMIAGASQDAPNVRSVVDPRAQQHVAPCEGSHKGSKSFIDILEDMSLPSTSSGEISDVMSQANFSTAGASLSDQIKYHLDVAQQTQPQENSICRTPSFATAWGGIDPETGHSSASAQYRHDIAMQQYKAIQAREQQMKRSLAGLGGSIASIPQGAQCHQSAASSIFSGNSISESQVKALEYMFAGAPQTLPKRRVSDSGSHQGSTRGGSTRGGSTRGGSTRGGSTRGSRSFVDFLEDMSLPSMSIGEISDFSSQGASLSRSKHSLGGTIAEDVEMDVADNDDIYHAPKPPEIAVGSGQRVTSNTHVISSMAGHRESIDDRRVTFLGNEDNPSEAAVAAMLQLQAMKSANPYQQSPQLPFGPNPNKSHGAKSRKRPSLSSYYRDMKESAGAMSLDSR